MKEIMELIIKEFSLHSDEVSEDVSLFRSNLLDSVDLVQLVALLEEEYDISIVPQEVVPNNFDTIRSIFSFVESKKQPV